ncbi:conserved hypothetical protein [Aurantimonas manganoxydans SI85-9A1]|uniref:Uncharacterized protein n=1 Tax=Aurantimonas manganoxydans (strain ATCC BAA-1229 / DSM 21871 / SI85-9A1) TaxID=287752 RepID=Q1YIW4_AURMS|nr:hypothetical protein [Aurantimonas manganoxydans]EAS50003.1 conserved hypothetical protein [Aurantimonas manganoxydans SI85-9A1]
MENEYIPNELEQLRPAIVRSIGSTASERYLALISEKTFLNLWSYPNPYRSQKLCGGGDGKELCDLLVVCDPHIIVFSEKDISWTDKPDTVAWPRWFRKAVLSAATQLKGAERWLSEFPDRIFLDRSCGAPFPLEFPSVETRRLHRIVVARGAAEACRRYFDGGLGTLALKPGLKGNDHCNPDCTEFLPFAVGDIDPEGDFVHVFDEVSLDIVMHELDTISDFTDYLDKRANFLRSWLLHLAHGEEDLLAYYAIRINEVGEHDFTPPNDATWDDIGSLVIGAGHYSAFIENEQYKAKKKADEVSYAWDRLIETFTNHMLGGTSIVLPGYNYSLNDSEKAVRYMALQSRYIRRSHSEAIMGALSIGREREMFFRAMLASPESRENETGFFFITMKYMDWMKSRGGYEKYRIARTFYLQTYAQALLIKYPYLKRIVGIAMEPPDQGGGASEDIVYAEQIEWTHDDRERVLKDCEALSIMKPFKEIPYRGMEFPEVSKSQEVTQNRGNRRERRAEAARIRNRRSSGNRFEA